MQPHLMARQDVEWFVKGPVYDESGLHIVAWEPVEDLCKKCGIGIESYILSPDDIQTQKASIIKWVCDDRQRKGEFICMTQFLDDNGKLARDWAPGHVFTTTISGVRSYVDGDFVTDDNVFTKLGDMPESAPQIQRACVLNDKLEAEMGIVVPAGTLPKDVPSRPVQAYVESQTSWVAYKLQHSESLRAGHAESMMKYQMAVERKTRPNSLTLTGKPQTWSDIEAIMAKLQQQRQAAIQAREAARRGQAPAATAVPVSASRLGCSSSSSLAGPSGPPTGAANRGNRVVAGFPKAATGSRAPTPPRPAGPPRHASPAPRLPSTPRVARPPPAAAAGRAKEACPLAAAGGRTASTSPAKPIGDASASAARRTVAPRGPASSGGGGGVDGGSGTEEGGAGRSRVAQISFEDLTVDKVLAGYCPTRQLNPVASSATFLHRSNRLSLVA